MVIFIFQMFPGNHREPNLGFRLLYKAGEEKMAIFEIGVGKTNCKILLFIICVLTHKSGTILKQRYETLI